MIRTFRTLANRVKIQIRQEDPSSGERAGGRQLHLQPFRQTRTKRRRGRPGPALPIRKDRQISGGTRTHQSSKFAATLGLGNRPTAGVLQNAGREGCRGERIVRFRETSLVPLATEASARERLVSLRLGRAPLRRRIPSSCEIPKTRWLR